MRGSRRCGVTGARQDECRDGVRMREIRKEGDRSGRREREARERSEEEEQ